MAGEHIVMQGECFSSIAKEYGFLEQTLWNHAANAALKNKRKNPNVLLPGDVVTIPDRVSGEESASTEQKHVFKAKDERVKLQLRMLRDSKPRAGIKFTLVVDGRVIESATDGDGWIREKIFAAAKTGKLILLPGTDGEEQYELLLGNLDPVEEESGIIGRLQNLGYFIALEQTEDPALELALEKFQVKNNLEKTGRADATTREKLKQMHGS